MVRPARSEKRRPASVGAETSEPPAARVVPGPATDLPGGRQGSRFTHSGIPFRSALDPLVAGGRANLQGVLPSQGAVAASVVDDLLESLAGDLAEILLPSLLEWFLAHPGRHFLDPGATAAHDDFVARLAGGEITRRISDQPLLARLVASATQRWSERARGVIERASADVDVLRREFGIRPPFVVARPLSDTGWRLVDTHGRAVIYKHRTLHMQRGFAEIVHWLNAQGLSLDLRAAKTVSRDTHGWTEDVLPRPGAGRADDRDYDVRIGMLAGLLHALGGGDLHFGNICRSGAYPIVLDCEKLLRPLYPAETLNNAVVLLTGLLPFGPRPLHCGLATEHWVDRPRHVAHVGTDAVRIASTRIAIDAIHEAFRRSVSENLAQRIADLTRGFTQVYRRLRHGGLPLDALADAEARVMVRFFGHYREILARLLEPDSLASSAARAAVMGSLRGTPSAMRGFGPVRRAVESAERRDLAAGRLPRFTTPATTRRLEHRRALLGTPFRLSPIAKSQTILRTMSDAIMARGCDEIASSLSTLSPPPSPWSAAGASWNIGGTAGTVQTL